MLRFSLLAVMVSAVVVGCSATKSYTTSSKVNQQSYAKNEFSNEGKKLDSHRIQKNINSDMLHKPIHNITLEDVKKDNSYMHLPSRMIWIKSPNGKWNIRIKRD